MDGRSLGRDFRKTKVRLRDVHSEIRVVHDEAGIDRQSDPPLKIELDRKIVFDLDVAARRQPTMDHARAFDRHGERGVGVVAFESLAA